MFIINYLLKKWVLIRLNKYCLRSNTLLMLYFSEIGEGYVKLSAGVGPCNRQCLHRLGADHEFYVWVGLWWRVRVYLLIERFNWPNNMVSWTSIFQSKDQRTSIDWIQFKDTYFIESRFTSKAYSKFFLSICNHLLSLFELSSDSLDSDCFIVYMSSLELLEALSVSAEIILVWFFGLLVFRKNT